MSLGRSKGVGQGQLSNDNAQFLEYQGFTNRQHRVISNDGASFYTKTISIDEGRSSHFEIEHRPK